MIKRTKEQRQAEVRPIIQKLTELHIPMNQYDEIKLLFKEMQRYIQDGVRVELNIPFESYNTIIQGVLAIDIKERTVVKFSTVG